MNNDQISATIQGGAAGVVGARYVRVENLYVGSITPSPEKSAGPIPPSPYPGLAYFVPQDASRYFGRDEAILALERAISKRSFTALVGASGSGKSSVVLAGLAPRLDAVGGWRSSYFRLGTELDKNPFAALARAIAPLLVEGDVVDRMRCAQKLGASLESGELTLANVVAQCRAANPGKRVLLIADQFEEVFTLVADESLRNRFIDALIAAFPDPASRAPDVCLVLTLRADFYNAALRHRPLADKLQNRVENLGPMTRDELREAVVKPASDAEVEFEPGLVDAILDDVERRPGSLPLLQFALREMWGRLEKPLMTRAAYEAIGGVEGALAKRAQAIFDGATEHGANAASVARFRRLFTRLVTLGEGAEDTRRIVSRGELGPDAWALAQTLADADNRLVVTAALAPGQETAEVVHEALIRNWPALVDWVNRDRTFQSWLRVLKPRVDEWVANPSDEGTLLRGRPLAIAEDTLARRGDELNEEEKAFIAASRAQLAVEKRREEDALKQEQERLREIAVAQANTARLQRRARWSLGAIAAVVIASATLFYLQYVEDSAELSAGKARLVEAQTALNQQQSAVSELQRSLEARQLELKHQHANLLGELARAQWDQGNRVAALHFAAKGAEDDLALPAGPNLASASTAALAAEVVQEQCRLAFKAGERWLGAAAFSPDGLRIVTASYDRTARVWDVATAKQIAVLSGHEGEVFSAAFSPDGSRIVTASSDNTARVWNAATAQQIVVLRGHEKKVWSAVFSPDGSRIVTASSDRTARVWDAATAKEIVPLRGHEGEVLSAAFSPDGSRVITGSGDKTARIWDVATAKEIAVLRGHDGEVWSASFSPDGFRALTASVDRTARVWDAAAANETTVLRGHEGGLWSAAFSPDGSRIVTASADKTARVWDAATAREITVFRGHEGGVSSAAFNPDGASIVTASFDKTVRVWNAAATNEIAVLRGHGGGVWSAAFSPDGSRIVSASGDKTARVWDAATAREIAVLRGHEGAVSSACFSPDGLSIVTTSDDKTARVWNAVTAKQIAVLSGHQQAVRSAAFSPDGSRIVTASWDKTARVWDAATTKQIAVLEGHESYVTSAAFSPDGLRILTTSGDKTARLWDAATGNEIAVLRGHDGEVWPGAFSPDGSRIVTASSDKTARVWDAATAKEITVLRGHHQGVRSAAFSAHGSRIVTASADRTARVWDAATAKEIAVLSGHEDWAISAAFSPDGSRIVTASLDNTARVWDAHFATMPAKSLIAEVCQHRLLGLGTMTRDEMRLAGYPDSTPVIDVCRQ